MLTNLRIKNLALVSDLSLELRPGYNAITGETGAGKSVMIGAVKLLSGERADRSMIRSGCESCSVEASVEVGRAAGGVAEFLERNGFEPCEEGVLILKRTLTLAGGNRQFVNGSQATLQALAELGGMLFDLHGPHDHQSLLNPGRQLDLVDAHAGLGGKRAEFGVLVLKRQALQREMGALAMDEKAYAQKVDLLRFQSGEIEAARLEAGEDVRVDEEYRKASNAARLVELSRGALGVLNEDDNSLLTMAGALGRSLHELERLDPEGSCLVSLHQQALESWKDLLSDLSHYADSIDLNPERLNQLQERLDMIQNLKRKYGTTLDDVIAFGERARTELALLEGKEDELVRLGAEIRKLDVEIDRVGVELSALRARSLSKFSKSVETELSSLGFKQSHFSVTLVRGTREALGSKLSGAGFDTIEFQFSPNPGEPERPLRSIASSGEMARVMLALKTVLADEDDTPVLIFDEVDANVGGETANAVGAKMRRIGEKHQVLCVTHLAPVAAAANHHFVVTKTVKEGRTLSEIRLLEASERVEEVGRMLGGVDEAALQHARALLTRSSARI